MSEAAQDYLGTVSRNRAREAHTLAIARPHVKPERRELLREHVRQAQEKYPHPVRRLAEHHRRVQDQVEAAREHLQDLHRLPCGEQDYRLERYEALCGLARGLAQQAGAAPA